MQFTYCTRTSVQVIVEHGSETCKYKLGKLLYYNIDTGCILCCCTRVFYDYIGRLTTWHLKKKKMRLFILN